MSRKHFRNLEDAVEYLYSEQVDADIAALPPEVDELTDEDDLNDDDLGLADILEIPGGTEVFIENENSDQDKHNISSSDEEDNLPLASIAKKKKRDPNKSFLPDWSKSEPQYEHTEKRDAEELYKNIKEQLVENTPLQIFENFFDELVFKHIVTETKRYAAEYKNKHNYSITVEEIKIFIGFLIFTGYHQLPSERDYWSEQEDLGIPLVKNAFSRNTYLEMKSLIHFTNNSEANDNKHDKSFKIRPLLNLLNTRFQQWGVFHQHLAVDEMIVKYYGHNALKQFIRAKPIRFGFKLWALCGDNGYCYNFALYCGKTVGEESNEPLGTRVVSNMLNIVKNPQAHFVYFDNFFTSYNLLCQLKKEGYCATGTIRENRTAKCPTKPSKDLEKEPRGTYDWCFDNKNKILICKWNDSKCVSVATNFDTVFPTNQVQRWNKKERKKIPVPQPSIISNYNKHMGGVDHHDWLLEKHHISVRGKKWYWCLFTRMIDMAIVNGCVLYNMIHEGNKLSIKEYRREVAYSYLKSGHGQKISKGRPFSLPQTSRSNIPEDIRYDSKNHIVAKREKQRRCQNRGCTSKPRTFCQKCNVTLCISTCFDQFHKKN